MTINATYETTTPAFRLTATPTAGTAFPLTDPSQYGNRPLAAFLQATVENIRFTTDGSTPTASHGQVLTVGNDPFLYSGPLIDLQFIREAAGAILNVIYGTPADTVGPEGPPGPQGAAGSQGIPGPTGPAGDAALPITAVALDSVLEVAANEVMSIDANGNPLLTSFGLSGAIAQISFDSDGFVKISGDRFTTTPDSSVVPQTNGDMVFEATSDTTLTVKYKGSDGVVRSSIITLS